MLLRTKEALSKLRASKTQDFQSHTPAPIAKKALISKGNYKYNGKVENTGIDEEFAHSKSVTFSGTDNGFHTMTETASFSTKRFGFSFGAAKSRSSEDDLSKEIISNTRNTWYGKQKHARDQPRAFITVLNKSNVNEHANSKSKRMLPASVQKSAVKFRLVAIPCQSFLLETKGMMLGIE
ncbi:hypothetical protein K7432_013282 [Basidiobolus ranarum]|uniref:Uncharacterized protein n=1 Tax=Basidiobolus ranarum TaxID=34480 RepID=A0ABR2VR12_9FUNG